MRLIETLDQAGIPWRDSGPNTSRSHVNICCPHCGDDRYHLGIHREIGWWLCWRCNAKGQWSRLARTLQEQHPRIDWRGAFDGHESFYTDAARPPRAFRHASRPFYSYRPDHIDSRDLEAWEYLVCERDIDPAIITKVRPQIGLRARRSGERSLHGYVVFSGTRGVVARNMRERGPRYLTLASAPFLFGEQLVEATEPEWIVLCEGLFDALAVPLGHGLAILGSRNATAWFERLAEFLPSATRTAIVALDPDVDRQALDGIRLNLRDLGLKAIPWRWGDDDIEAAREHGKPDLDTLRRAHGEAWIAERIRELLHGGLDDLQELI